jgi:hypothetical protein
MLFLTGIFKRSGVCSMLLGYLRGMARVLCDWDV